ncbi:unnamed protein product [Albugo candida]|uniref:F-actin-capping protein subunit alpha n=1 Tax=Albugo candida TaxID=65357 RepID=A0A024GT45_9STRA|nr:unnamed protein product [Albugo candida]|eukprot:CCI49929.1 unnamed protein product [Albugo candida]
MINTSISEDQARLILRDFLLSSPPGQTHEVLKELKELLPEQFFSSDYLKTLFEHYHHTNYFAVAIPNQDHKLLICQESQIDEKHYVDPRTNLMYGFDHFTQELNEIPSAELKIDTSGILRDERLAIENALQDYEAREYMNEANTAVYAKESKLLILMCTERVNLRNYWSGQWKSRWEVDVGVQPNVMSGEINLHVHYYENGNLQLQDTKKVQQTLSLNKTPLELGEEVIRVIKDAEDSLQNSLDELYINMSHETLKEMRRIMPVTQTKMDWSLHLHRTAKDLAKR